MKKQELINKAKEMGIEVNDKMKVEEIRNLINKEEETMKENNNNQQEQQVEVKIAIFENIKSYLNANPDLLNKIKGMSQEEFNEWIPANIDLMLTGSTEHVRKMSVNENLKKISKNLCADLAARAEMVDLTRKNAIRKGTEFFVSFLKWAIGILIEVLRVVFKIVFCVVAAVIKSLLCIPASIKELFDNAEKAGEELADDITDDLFDF